MRKEVLELASNESKTPEFLKIKGYKYRAKMLIAGAVILIVFIIIVGSIIHAIASALHRNSADSAVDTDTDTVSSDTAAVSSISSSASAAGTVVSSFPVKEEKLDADGKVVIDTDTLDGKKAIAITFDDGPSEYTSDLIDELNSRGVHATFFMVGKCVEQYPETVKKMADGGHQLGNHSYDHSDLAKLGVNAALDQIGRTDEAVMNACGHKPTAFRPPYGSYTDELIKNVDKTVTLWSLDTLDWKSKDMGKIKNTIVSQCRDGSIILLHDLYKPSVDGALAAIDELQGEGYVFVTVDELMTRYGYGITSGAHSAQYAVYETNSPHAADYKADMERDRERENSESSNAASGTSSAFYYEPHSDIDSDDLSDSDVNSYYSTAESSSVSSKLVY